VIIARPLELNGREADNQKRRRKTAGAAQKSLERGLALCFPHFFEDFFLEPPREERSIDHGFEKPQSFGLQRLPFFLASRACLQVLPNQAASNRV